MLVAVAVVPREEPVAGDMVAVDTGTVMENVNTAALVTQGVPNLMVSDTTSETRMATDRTSKRRARRTRTAPVPATRRSARIREQEQKRVRFVDDQASVVPANSKAGDDAATTVTAGEQQTLQDETDGGSPVGEEALATVPAPVLMSTTTRGPGGSTTMSGGRSGDGQRAALDDSVTSKKRPIRRHRTRQRRLRQRAQR
ncbi:hypothetical protein P3T76_015555 [Phytophthora citrophthora]|uniref:Uncharacterized protein n=1 Tax=Phytophthora citrophthora TaxID=4793 RepID=A0AAD9FZF6_9STRA|nr:hypothetical protein P3T76_015555 [Phytophthora citrophthora]